MGRKKEPINVVVEKGKKHLTKAEIQKRQESELPVYDDKIEIPKNLPKKYHKEFEYYITELKRLNIVSNLDIELLAKYVVIKDLHNKVVEKLQTDDLFLDKNLVNTQDKYFKQLVTLSRELGLTVSSRLKLVVDKKEEESKENATPCENLFKGEV